MSETITIKFNDHVSGKCPTCSSADIRIVQDAETTNGFGELIERTYMVVCSHKRVCKHLKELLEGGDND